MPYKLSTRRAHSYPYVVQCTVYSVQCTMSIDVDICIRHDTGYFSYDIDVIIITYYS